MPFSGPSWVAQFPGSRSLDDLVEPFRTNAQNFIDALKAAGAEVNVSATLRPPERAWLMHYSFLVSRGQCTPASVPARDGLDIQWVHLDPAGSPDHQVSIGAASAMVAGYEIVFAPVLEPPYPRTSRRHGHLVDRRPHDHRRKRSAHHHQHRPSRCGNADLHGIGETYGVIKLLSDPPHWSSDGH